jgi:hypothetical protein
MAMLLYSFTNCRISVLLGHSAPRFNAVCSTSTASVMAPPDAA